MGCFRFGKENKTIVFAKNAGKFFENKKPAGFGGFLCCYRVRFI